MLRSLGSKRGIDRVKLVAKIEELEKIGREWGMETQDVDKQWEKDELKEITKAF